MPPAARHAFDPHLQYRASTDYGIDDDIVKIPIQPNDANFNIGASSLLGFALGLRPSKDIFWTHRPANCRGNPATDPNACGRYAIRILTRTSLPHVWQMNDRRNGMTYL